MADPHSFLYTWLKDGAEMWLAGDWTDLALDRLYGLMLRLRASAEPAWCRVGGRGVRVLRGATRHGIACGLN